MKPAINAHIVGKLPLASEKQLFVTTAETEPNYCRWSGISEANVNQILIWFKPGV